jgi:hypothetical protein
MSAAVAATPLPTELKARLVTWLVLLLVVLVSAILLWMGALLAFGAANLVFERAFGYAFDNVSQELFIATTGTAYGLAAAFTYFCLVRGTLRGGAR